ncbi:hypothetical protein SEA_WOFFORD_196 [Streptomyces phage Wofford]|uniref:Uncharacterized protein n=1 Tax=Streptomyces phage Wofford TaxID=2283267 RepID=A0A345MA17_9CAUD|nr:hypothetical protein HWB78_gp117 [Streptomyces phage Wollford]AXH67338.1 hypothetical protein SEA_WOFFORD_196 [Streptomyces phage Wollford]
MFDRLVRSYDYSCNACPVIVDGFLISGEPFYFRLRHGVARLVLEDTKRAAVMNAIDGLDGTCSNEQFKQMFMRLYLEIITKDPA